MDFLPQLLKRPAMYLSRQEASRLECFLHGWEACMAALPLKDVRYQQFDHWLEKVKYGKGGPMRALSRMIDELGEEGALQWFKECFEEYVAAELIKPQE